jgi:hypothetical protein
MRIQINLSDKRTPEENSELCSCIGYNANMLVSEYEKWKSSNAHKNAKFEKKMFWFYRQELKFRIKCNGKTMYITEIENQNHKTIERIN